MPDSATPTYDVIVVGAGLSGLTAAHTLLRVDPSLSLLVLEASHRTGGSLVSKKFELEGRECGDAGDADAGNRRRRHPGTAVYDLSGQIIEEGETGLTSLLDQLGIETYTLPTRYHNSVNHEGNSTESCDSELTQPRLSESRDIYWPSQSSSQEMATRTKFDQFTFGNWLGRLDLLYQMWKLERMAAKIDTRHPYKNSVAARELDSQTYQSYLQQNCYTRFASDLLQLRLRTLFGQDPGGVSALFWLNYLASVEGGVAHGMFRTRPLRQRAVKGGAEEICRRLVDKIGSKRVVLNQPVNYVITTKEAVYVSTRLNATYHCRRLICALPPHLISNSIDFDPPLSSKLRYTLQNMTPAGAFSTFVLTFERRFWAQGEKRLSGTLYCPGGKTLYNPGGKTFLHGRPVLYTVDVTDAGDESGPAAIRGHLSGLDSLQWSSVDVSTLKLCLLETLSELLGQWVNEHLQFELSHSANGEPFSPLGCCTPRPETMAFNYTLRASEGRLHWAGKETATRWIGHMSGSVQSGQRAALQVLDELRPQALTAKDYAILKASTLSIKEIEESMTRPKKKKHRRRLFVWTVVLPALCIGAGYTALAWRERYSQLFIPM